MLIPVEQLNDLSSAQSFRVPGRGKKWYQVDGDASVQVTVETVLIAYIDRDGNRFTEMFYRNQRVQIPSPITDKYTKPELEHMLFELLRESGNPWGKLEGISPVAESDKSLRRKPQNSDKR